MNLSICLSPPACLRLARLPVRATGFHGSGLARVERGRHSGLAPARAGRHLGAAMWEKLTSIFTASGDADASGAPDEEALQLATAALLIRASLIDGKEDAAETERLRGLLAKRFDLSDAQTEELIARGRARDAEAVDLYGHTRILTEHLDAQGRGDMVEMLWEIVLSDETIDDFEANLVWRVSELLHISTRERVILRKKVATRLGLEDG